MFLTLPFWFFIFLAGVFGLTSRPAVAQVETQPVTGSLRVVTKLIEPFVMIQDGELTGFSIEIWEAIANDQGWDYQWIEVETVTQQLDAVMNGQLVVIGIILIAQFTAAVTASLTVQQLTGVIGGPSDLPGKRIATVQGSTSANYLDGEELDYLPVTRIDEAYQMLEAGEIDAVVYDAPVIQYYALHQGKGLVQAVGPLFQEETYGIALPSGSTLREDINESLLRLKQEGTFNTIYAKWFGNSE